MKDIKDYIHLYPNCQVQTPTRKYPDEGGKSYKLIGTVMCIDYVINQVGIHFEGNDPCNLVGYPFNEIKPILRPLSDMTEEEGNKCDELSGGIITTQTGRAEEIRYLLSRGFDLFGLIDSGLAIDKTKL